MTIVVPPSLDRVKAVWNGSDGNVTKELYIELAMLGPLGDLATNLFRACKNSTRAKKYRGRNNKGAAYETKQWAVGNIQALLTKSGVDLGIVWGWKKDPGQTHHNWVIYIDLPTGQASFHQDHRGEGPAYPGNWDHAPPGSTAERIILLAAMLLDGWPMPDRLAEIAAIPDSAIDTSDIPELRKRDGRRLKLRMPAGSDPDEPPLPF